MKLKKIASLALAGIMAVSMLTACGEGGKKEEDPSSSEVTTVSGAAAALNNALSQNKDVVKFEDDSNLDKNLEAHFKLNPIKGDEWAESNYGKIGQANTDYAELKSVIGVSYIGLTNYEQIVESKSADWNDKKVAVVGMFNAKVYTQAEALKMVGKAIDNFDYAEDTTDTDDGKEFTYSGKASVLEVKSEGGTASVWVVVAVVTRGYEKV